MRKIIVAGTLTILIGGLVAAVLLEKREGPTALSNEPQERYATVRQTLRVGPVTVTVELARTPDEWARGLSNRDTLSAGAGMLFVFPTVELRTFWMKNTRIPLDMMWILDGTLVGITANVQPEPGVPEDQLRRYRSPVPVDQVLEVNAGWSEHNGVRAGDPVALR